MERHLLLIGLVARNLGRCRLGAEGTMYRYLLNSSLDLLIGFRPKLSHLVDTMAVVRALAVVRRRREYVQVESVAREAANGAAGVSGHDHDILTYLSLLQHKIDSIIANYVGVNNIISIVDLERELVRILDIFCFNSIDYTIALINSNRTKKCESIASDPNEIELDTTIGNSSCSSAGSAFTTKSSKNWKSFIDFGLGCICKHPVILRLYQLNVKSCCLCDSNHGNPAFISSSRYSLTH